MAPRSTTDYYLDVIDKLNQARGLKANLEFKLEQASLRVAHYCESLYAIKRQIQELEKMVSPMQTYRHNKLTLMGRIESMGKRLGL